LTNQSISFIIAIEYRYILPRSVLDFLGAIKFSAFSNLGAYYINVRLVCVYGNFPRWEGGARRSAHENVFSCLTLFFSRDQVCRLEKSALYC